jgi:hypothetical protein
MFAMCFISSVFFMFVGSAAALVMGHADDWQRGSAIGCFVGFAAAIFIILGIRLARTWPGKRGEGVPGAAVSMAQIIATGTGGGKASGGAAIRLSYSWRGYHSRRRRHYG